MILINLKIYTLTDDNLWTGRVNAIHGVESFMMKVPIMYIVVLSIIFLFGCTSNTNQKDLKQSLTHGASDKPTIITGRILNQEVYPTTKELKLTIPGFRGDKTVYTAEINEDGNFRFEIYPKTKREINLYPIEDVIIVKPGDSIHILKDFKDIANTTFTGDGTKLNQAISKFRGQYLGRYPTDYQQSNEDFKKYCGQERECNYDRLANFVQESNCIDDDFVIWANKQIGLDYYKALFQYPNQHYFRTELVLKDSTEYYSFLEEMEQNIDNSIVLADYFDVASSYMHYYLFDLQESLKNINNDVGLKDTITDWFIEKVFSSTENNYLAQLTVSSYYNMNLSFNKTELIGYNSDIMDSDISKHIDKNIDNPFLKATLLEHYDRVREYNKNPKHFSDAILNSNNVETNPGVTFNTRADNNIVKGFIDKNRGKVIYIDFWTTWCSPCIEGMKYSKELIDEFKNEDIVFAFFCLNSREDLWKQRINQLKIGGKHIYCDAEATISIRQRFGFSGIPYYMLVNKEGVIVDYGHHLLPQSEQLKIEFEKLLSK